MHRGESNETVMMFSIFLFVPLVLVLSITMFHSLWLTLAILALFVVLLGIVVPHMGYGDASADECECNLKQCARAIRDFARENNNLYPTQDEFHALADSLKLPVICHKNKSGYEYLQASSDSPDDFIVLRCRNHKGIFGHPFVLELQLNGTVRQR